MIEDALTSYDIRKFYLSILYVIRRIDDVPGIYFLNNHQEHHPMQKHILSTCLAISLIANSSYVFADKTITGTGSSSSESEMSDGQAAAVVGGLLLLGGIMSLHSQSVAKAEETATQQATKTVELKPGHSYLWSTGSDDNNPLIEYVDSCTPAKQFTVKAKLANGIADSSDYYMSRTESECTRTYDSRQKAVQEYAGNPWNLNETTYQKELAEKKARQARAVEGAAKMIGGIGKLLFGSGGSTTADPAFEAQFACEKDCEAQTERAIATGCTGLDEGKFLIRENLKATCEDQVKDAEYTCKSACYAKHH
ncbi:MAG: hypothetical protein QJT81_06650 [Candidatus Thiothrix putei]|uniref:Uncharacterized protein n=1 Tax=Candidatus Thiothrix putei TaxID=3080811 RepID=A0AA95HE58_9GAMM|nr:MAG: hypothetical protein QJT81_06650 [Candidatus Thiothrix putei]